MKVLEIINASKQKVGEVALGESLTSEKVNKAVLYQAIRRALAGHHHGTVRTKTRAEVNRTNRKIYRQKGTGGARHSSRKTAPFVGGGRVFGPKPRDYSIKMPKKVRRLALREALKYQIQQGNLFIVDEIPFKEIKTKQACRFFKALGIEKGLVILEAPSDMIEKSMRNLKGIKVVKMEQFNVYDAVKFPNIVFTSKAFEQIKERYLTE